MTERILRKPDVEAMTGFCERHLRDMEAEGNFPKRFNPDPNSKAVGWLQSEILEWIASRASVRQAA
jgi:prophage regulatory protein